MLKRLRTGRSHKSDSSGEPESTPALTPTSLPSHARNTSTAAGSLIDFWNRRNYAPAGELQEPDRRTSVPSPNSSCCGTSSSSTDRSRQTLGLHVVHQPGLLAPLDIIFVHGLGGDSRKTWSKNHDPGLFWPGLWLPFEPDIGNARILSFGYNAEIRAGSPKSQANITDFAKELLFEMAFGKDKNGKDFGIGKVPIIFVVHSMGGLVVKKAYILGQNDEEYQAIIRSISAIMFLATPHRGTNLAATLNRVLTVSLHSPKNFIADLNKNSSALEDINEQFRHIAPKLSIVSFYETLATTVGPLKLMVLEKEASILGYPKEISRALNADHHDVCKYTSPEDSNYISVRNALKTLVGRCRPKEIHMMSDKLSDEAKDIERLLCIFPGPNDDLESFRRWWIPGTCDWLFHEPVIRSWLEELGESRIVWFNASPASGKSILSTHIINHLLQSNIGCQYFFFKFSDETKRSLNTLLRSLAWQISRDVPSFRHILIEISAEGISLEKSDPGLIWQKLFESVLFRLELDRPFYWVIDGLDESESPKALLDLFRNLSNSLTPIRVLIISRKTEPLILAFDRLSASVDVQRIEKDGTGHNFADIKMLVEKEIKCMRGSNELKTKVTQSIMRRAGGNFLWVRLVLEEILSCHTEEAIQETLEEMPNDMAKLYQRMELAIASNPRKSNRQLAVALFQWTICAHRSLTLKELSQALQPEFPEFIDLKRTIQDVCGQFVLVSQNGEVGMVHQTARDYLVQVSNKKIAIDPQRAHEHLFNKSISILLDENLRIKLTQSQHTLLSNEPFIFYASTSWPYHLRHAGASSDAVVELLTKFFKGVSVLTWIQSLAVIDRLEVMIQGAKALTTFVGSIRKQNASKKPLLHPLSDLKLLDLWIIDLVKVVGKFSTFLLSDPQAIYKLVPPFCPESSIIYQQFHQQVTAEVSVSGILNSIWSDNLARMTLPEGDQAWKIACGGPHIAVLGLAETIIIYSSSNFAEICILRHHEPVTAICINSKGNIVATCGLRTSKLWSVPSGQLVSTALNPRDSKSMSVTFAEKDSKIFMGGDDRLIRFIDTEDFDAGWRVLDPVLLRESSALEGTFVNSPICIAFNADSSQVGVSYRGFPLSVWSMSESKCIGRCKRVKDLNNNLARSFASWFAVDRFTWNPVTSHIIGIYRDGCIFKWHPITDETQEVKSQEDEVACSADGKLFVTSNCSGTVKVWNFTYFSIIYQLSSSDLVIGLAFSPDSRRFYDLRGRSVNAWESNRLIRLSEAEGSFNDEISQDRSITFASRSHISEAHVTEFEPISAIAISQTSPLYCSGNEEGVVELFDSNTGETFELSKFHNSMEISHLLWAEDGRHIVAADLGGDIVLKQLNIATLGNPTSNFEAKNLTNPKFDLKGRGIHQMLFSRDSKLLLVISGDKGHIWSITDAKLLRSVLLEDGTTRAWTNHPSQMKLVLGFGGSDVKVFQWLDFTENAVFPYHPDHPRLNIEANLELKPQEIIDRKPLSIESESNQELTTIVRRTIVAQDGKHILVQLKDTFAQGRSTKRLLIFDNAAFDKADKHLLYIYLPPSVMMRVNIPLGVLTRSGLVFLDQNNWVCTYKLSPSIGDGATNRHYFIPRDWASTDSLEFCCVMADGTLLCPKDDKVAVIRGNLETLPSLR